MPVKKRKTVKKRSVLSTIGSYVKKVMRTPAVKRAADSVKALEKKLTAAKKKKAMAVKKARKSLKK